MRLVTWNLNARRQIAEQIAAIANPLPDILALQEVTQRSVSTLRELLPAAGLSYVTDSFAASPPWTASGPRRYGLLIASRFPLQPATHAQMVVWPERLLSAHVLVPGHAVTVHTTHIPPGSTNYGKKIEMVEAVLAVVSEASLDPRILCGDFNLPQAETPQGRIVTWGEQVTAGQEPRLRARRYGLDGQRWDRAERTLMEGGAPRVFIDAYRHLHGYDREDFSWYLKRGPLRVGRRFDHIFCSTAVRIVNCEYRHDVREQGLSDHSALELDFEC
jgi:exonuclease III